MTFYVLQGDQPLKATWSVEEGLELHSMPFSKPLGAVLAGHTWYHSLCCICEQLACFMCAPVLNTPTLPVSDESLQQTVCSSMQSKKAES